LASFYYLSYCFLEEAFTAFSSAFFLAGVTGLAFGDLGALAGFFPLAGLLDGDFSFATALGLDFDFDLLSDLASLTSFFPLETAFLVGVLGFSTALDSLVSFLAYVLATFDLLTSDLEAFAGDFDFSAFLGWDFLAGFLVLLSLG